MASANAGPPRPGRVLVTDGEFKHTLGIVRALASELHRCRALPGMVGLLPRGPGLPRDPLRLGHHGPGGVPVVAGAREEPRSGLVIGASASDVDSAYRAARDGADYIGVGPIFPTPMKPGAKPVPPGTIAAIRRIISLPIVAIGGINQDNLIAPLEEGADGIAVISALHQCLCPGESTSRLKRALDQAKKR